MYGLPGKNDLDRDGKLQEWFPAATVLSYIGCPCNMGAFAYTLSQHKNENDYENKVRTLEDEECCLMSQRARGLLETERRAGLDYMEV